jgi:membrane-bound lytic murein transglycosylase A
VGPARADLYFGAGADAGRVSGRLRHNMRFVMLVPKSLDPVARGRKMPLPDPRPSETIARLFPQTDPLKDQQMDQKNGAKPPEASAAVGRASSAQTAAANPVPLPEARPNIKPSREARRARYISRYRRVR